MAPLEIWGGAMRLLTLITLGAPIERGRAQFSPAGIFGGEVPGFPKSVALGIPRGRPLLRRDL